MLNTAARGKHLDTQLLWPIARLLFIYLFVYLFIYLFICLFIYLFIYLFLITSFNVGTLKQLIVNKDPPLNTITKIAKTIIIIIIITNMNAYSYTVICVFGILNNCNQYF